MFNTFNSRCSLVFVVEALRFLAMVNYLGHEYRHLACYLVA